MTETNTDGQNMEEGAGEVSAEELEMLKALEDTGPAEGTESVEVNTVELPHIEDTAPAEPSKVTEDANLKMILDIPVDIRLELGRTQLPIRDVLQLVSGSVIELDRLSGSPADIIVNGELVGRGDVVVIDEHFGVRVTKLIDPAERIKSA